MNERKINKLSANWVQNFEILAENKKSDKNCLNRMMTRFVLKIVFTLFCLMGCSIQLGTVIYQYFDYPTTVYIDKITMEKLYLPGITLCNNNRVVWSKLEQFDKDFRRKWDQISYNNTVEERILKQKLIDQTMRQMIKDLPVFQFIDYGFQFKQFVMNEFTRCSSDKFHPGKPCSQAINEITSAQEFGNCFTLFHHSRTRKLRTMATIAGFSGSPIKTGVDSLQVEVSEEAINPNEVIRIKVNFHREEYTNLNEPVMGRIIMHDDDEVPIVRERSFTISPGNYYEFYLQKETDSLLPKPYGTDCTDHRHKREKARNEYLYKPMSKPDCVIGCMAKITMDMCNCWPPEIPFISGSDEKFEESSMIWCDWDDLDILGAFGANRTKFERCFSDHEMMCSKQCKNDCLKDRFKIIREVRHWPSRERIAYSGDKEYFEEMRDCCAVISVRYWNSEQTINLYQPKLKEAEFTSTIGGLLSIWIGFSLLGFYEIMENVIKFVRKHITHIRKPVNKSQSSQKDFIQQMDNKLILWKRENEKQLHSKLQYYASLMRPDPKFRAQIIMQGKH